MNPPHTLVGLCAAVLLATPLAAKAVTCLNSIPPSNPDSAYIDHGDGTVTHTPTGLMWKRCSEGQSWDGTTCTGAAGGHNWQAALDLAEAHSFAGHSDWRMPNSKELRNLVEECRANPAINDTIFPETPSSIFWSGSPHVSSSNDAWWVSFATGSLYYYPRSSSYHVRLVRSGQSFAAFDARGDATPDALGDFTAVTNAIAGALTGSTDSKTVTGITTETGVSIAGEGGPEYRIDGGAWTSAPGAVENGAVLEVRLTAGAAGSTRVATLTVGGVDANFSVTVAAGGSGGGAPPPIGSWLPVPTGPQAYACRGPEASGSVAADPAAAQPISSTRIFDRELWLNVSLGTFARPMDVYIVAELPSYELLVLNSVGQWLPYPAHAVPWRPRSTGNFNARVWRSALADIPPGPYAAYLVLLPVGTDPASFDLASSVYHLWCTTRTLP